MPLIVVLWFNVVLVAFHSFTAFLTFQLWLYTCMLGRGGRERRGGRGGEGEEGRGVIVHEHCTL